MDRIGTTSLTLEEGENMENLVRQWAHKFGSQKGITVSDESKTLTIHVRPEWKECLQIANELEVPQIAEWIIVQAVRENLEKELHEWKIKFDEKDRRPSTKPNYLF